MACCRRWGPSSKHLTTAHTASANNKDSDSSPMAGTHDGTVLRQLTTEVQMRLGKAEPQQAQY